MNIDSRKTIENLCDKGNSCYAEERFDSALRLFYQAWLKVPKPQHEQMAATKVLTHIGDTYYRMGKYEPAIEALRSALACPETDDHRLALLRLGQSLLNMGQELQARIYLHKAYRLTCKARFAKENPKYRQAIADLVI